jgi:hypothetical protein
MTNSKALAVALISASLAGAAPVLADEAGRGLGRDGQIILALLSPVSHFGITAGPIPDFPPSGSQSTEMRPNPGGGRTPSDGKVTCTNYGLTVGVLGYF